MRAGSGDLVSLSAWSLSGATGKQSSGALPCRGTAIPEWRELHTARPLTGAFGLAGCSYSRRKRVAGAPAARSRDARKFLAVAALLAQATSRPRDVHPLCHDGSDCSGVRDRAVRASRAIVRTSTGADDRRELAFTNASRAKHRGSRASRDGSTSPDAAFLTRLMSCWRESNLEGRFSGLDFGKRSGDAVADEVRVNDGG